jgi:glutamate-ammonia-ligase adenylyltransferase
MSLSAERRADEKVSLPELGRLLTDDVVHAAWCRASGLVDSAAARAAVLQLAAQGIPADLVADLAGRFTSQAATVCDPDRVFVTLARFVAACRSPLSAVTLFQRDPPSLTTLLRIFSASPYLAEIVIADPEGWEQVRLGRGRAENPEQLRQELRAEVSRLSDPATAMRALRRFKRRQTLRIAYGDLVVGQRLEQVVGQISAVADAVIEAALHFSHDLQLRLRGQPLDVEGRPATIAVVALGKLGGGELNYSSDVDLVFVFSAEGRVVGPKPCDHQEFFTRVVQEAVRLMTDVTELGIAYRVDLRLRPHGSNGPLVMPLDSMLQYFDRQGRTWERQAWVKARCVAGDGELGRRLLARLEPWIYRRWLTRSDISGIRALKRRIEQRSRRDGGDGSDLKIGHGGIRDIEYTIQFLQLLGGGETADIRTGNTLLAIRRLAAAGSLTDQERAILERNYTLLRTVEHRLQMLYDRQTHRLPEDGQEFMRLAVRCGFGVNSEWLRREIDDATALNRRILDHLLHEAFPDDERPELEVDLVLDPSPDQALVAEILSGHGFRDVDQAHRLLCGLAEERSPFFSTHRTRHFLAAVTPRLLSALAATPDPDASLAVLAAVSDSLGGKGVLWELFSSHPPSLDLAMRLCSLSPFLARLLVTHPGMIDELLDSLMLRQIPGIESLEAELWDLCRNAVDPLPILLAYKASQMLRIGVRDLLGKTETADTRRALTGVAEATLRVVLGLEEEKLRRRLGRPLVGGGDDSGRPASMVVLAMGKFGGREMNYASDLDVIFLYDHDGVTGLLPSSPRSQTLTTNAHFFAELASRTMRTFNAFTPQGRLYDMDSRLRPSGRSGPAAISIDVFERYFAADGPAAPWERQTLVKARVVSGPAAAMRRLEGIIAEASYGKSWSKAEIEGIREMRYRLQEGAASTNLKRAAGGTVDVEFIVQLVQLLHGSAVPAVRTADTLGCLQVINAVGLLPASRCELLGTGYEWLRLVEGRLRLLDTAAHHDLPEDFDERRRLAHMVGSRSAEHLTAETEERMALIREAFENTFDEALASRASSDQVSSVARQQETDRQKSAHEQNAQQQ